jgi:SRSO17 transposase
MDANQIRQLKPMLRRYLERFDDCFSRKDTRAHMPVYVEGQLSPLKEKSCEPIALRAGVAPRTLQEFLAQHKWDEGLARRRLQEIVMKDHSGPHSIGLIDETSDVKKGTKTPGVQRQWCGAVGRPENCIVTVHLGYATNDFHCLLDGELFLPESWSLDRERCRAAGIPDDMVYRSKWRIALELYDRARQHGVSFDWLTFDEGYGAKPGFLQALCDRGQLFVAEVSVKFASWIKPPRVIQRPYRRWTGRPRKMPRLACGSRPAVGVRDLLKHSPELRDQAWVRYRVKDGDKGPMVWDVKHAMITMKNEDGLPGQRLHLIVSKSVLDVQEIKFFVSNAPVDTSVQKLLLVAFSRWRVERCFEDQKGEVGLDKWEGRKYLSLKRHLILTSISYLFLAKVRETWRGKKSAPYGIPNTHRSGRPGAILVA